VIVFYQDDVIIEAPLLLALLGCGLLLLLLAVFVLSYLLNVSQVIICDGLRVKVVVV